MNLTQTVFTAARQLYPRPTILFSETPDYREPVVFVANHEKNYGPSIMQLFFPIPYRPWVIHRMLERNVCREYIREDFFEGRMGVPAPFSDWVAGLLERPLLGLMHSTRPIPVYREAPGGIVQTFNQSIAALENGENLLIFPENGKLPHYSPRVKDIHTGFIYLAKLFHRRTGRSLTFVPVAINPSQDALSVGLRTVFNPGIDFRQEQERIRKHLLRQIDGLYNLPWQSSALTRSTAALPEGDPGAAFPAGVYPTIR